MSILETGVVPGALTDPVVALYVEKKNNAEKLCVSTPFVAKAVCYKGKWRRDRVASNTENSFQQTLIYSGRVGNKLRIGYREFNNRLARDSFSNEVEYDLSVSKTIGYKGAVIEVIEADNRKIVYRLVENFR